MIKVYTNLSGVTVESIIKYPESFHFSKEGVAIHGLRGWPGTDEIALTTVQTVALPQFLLTVPYQISNTSAALRYLAVDGTAK